MIKKLILCLFCFLSLIIDIHADSTVLLIKMPTRSRPEKFFKTLNLYYKNLSKDVPYHFVISCDFDDETMNNPKVINRLRSYPHLSYYFGNSKSKIEACNADVEKHLDFQIIMLVSDDMIPVVQNFDQIILNHMVKYFPDFDGLIHFNDGYTGEILNTLPILGKKYYEQFGYIYYPEYKSFYCDDEMMEVSKILGKSVYVDEVIIEHRHPVNIHENLDDLYIRNDKYWDQDKALFYKRQSRNFDLPSE